MKDNSHYFNFSLEVQDTFMDFTNPNGVQVIATSKKDKQTQLQVNNKKLIELIISYKTLRQGNYPKKITNKIIENIIDILNTTNFINYSSFCVYFQVLRCSYSTFQQIKDKNTKVNLLRKILDNYIQNRHNMYMSYGYSDQILQTMSDSSSSRRNSKTGITKIENIICPLGFNKVSTLEHFKSEDKCYILPDKGNSSLFDDILSEFKIDFVFKKERDNKYPDMLFKIKRKIFILEHKLTNDVGGSQNSEINEIISFIGEKETNINVSYISCLQGNYMTILTPDNKQPKARTQYNNIIKNLSKNKRNYFVNGNGFSELIKDLNS